MSLNLINNLTFNNTPYIARIQDTDYIFEVTIFNGDGRAFRINQNAMVDFKIVDELQRFYHYGFIIFKNDLDVLEAIETIDADNNNKTFNPYVFRGDGRDFIKVTIKPTLADGDLVTGRTPSSEFVLDFIFSVYDYEDLHDEDRTQKYKKLYFWDYSYMVLCEQDSYFTTSKYSKGLSNSDRSMYTGDAIKNLLKETFEDQLQATITFDKDWDLGSSKLFYSSPAGYKVIDDLNYLIDRHVSSKDNDYSPCILKRERNYNFSLRPINSYFKGAYYKGNQSLGNLGGNYLIENFVIGKEDSSDNTMNNSPIRSPGISINASNLADVSYIENFSVSNMAADDTQSKLVSYYVHNYDNNSKLFSIDSNENNFESNSKIYNKNVVSYMKGREGRSPYTNTSSNKFRSENKNINHVFNNSITPEQRLNSGRNKYLLDSIFLNTTLSLRTNGSTRRQSGRFITVQRNNSQADSSFDNKMMGIYLISSITHSFIKGGYSNYVVCNKMYNMDDSKLSKDIL